MAFHLHPVLALWILASSVIANAEGRDAVFLLQDGTERPGLFLRLRSDTVWVAVPDAESTKVFGIHKFEFRKVVFAGSDSLLDLSLSDYELPKESSDTLSVDSAVVEGRAFLRVRSDPEEGRVYVDSRLATGLTPVLLHGLPAGRHTIAVRKYLKGVDWWGVEEVELKDGDTTAVEVKLLKPRTALKVISQPSGAEVYLNAKPSLDQTPPCRTECTLKDIPAGPGQSLFLFALGYHDTVLTVDVESSMPNRISVEMRRMDEIDSLETQKSFVSRRSRHQAGRICLWISPVPLVAAGVFYWYADQDWDDAAKAKRAYDQAAFASSETDALLAENHSKNRSGDRKAWAAGALGGVGVLLGAVGIALRF